VLNVDGAIAGYWSQGNDKILVYVSRECLQTYELTKWDDIKGADKTITNSL